MGELVEVAVGGAEVHPGVAAGIGRWLQEELDPGRAQLGGRGLEVVDQEPGHRAGGEVAVDRAGGAEDLDLIGPPLYDVRLGVSSRACGY